MHGQVRSGELTPRRGTAQTARVHKRAPSTGMQREHERTRMQTERGGGILREDAEADEDIERVAQVRLLSLQIRHRLRDSQHCINTSGTATGDARQSWLDVRKQSNGGLAADVG